MKKYLACLSTLLVFCVFSVSAQTLSPFVLSASGGSSLTASGTLSFTVAEMTMVQTFTGATNILTQGFQQPEFIVSTLPDIDIPVGEMLIYPNPTQGHFSLTFNSNEVVKQSVKIYNLIGQVIYAESYEAVQGLNQLNFDISKCSQGIYMIELNENGAVGNKKKNIRKINLIY